jgi:hypothetical protein
VASGLETGGSSGATWGAQAVKSNIRVNRQVKVSFMMVLRENMDALLIISKTLHSTAMFPAWVFLRQWDRDLQV